MKESIKIVILLGAPGSGKGTVAQYIKDKYDIYYFSTGNLLRNEVKEKTDIGCKVENILGSGGLVGDDIVNEIVEKNIKKFVKNGKVILLDGYPRTKNQALALDTSGTGEFKKAIRVVELDIDAKEAITRISLRRVCVKCGNTYGPTDRVAICPCGGELIRRKDDEKAVILNRLKEYEKATFPLSQYYLDRIIRIQGSGTPEEVANRVDNCLYNFGMEKRR
ncbi:MAG: nucleoside monophosphate kinase [Holosporaceae bacterium]|jgi:adenylate kinase|nr:nucleoside monophosphate kinase [Holosporaceae bacterium]